MSYEAWRITFQDSEKAARAAYAMAEEVLIDAKRWRHARKLLTIDDIEGAQGEVWELGCLEHEGGCGATMHGDSRDDALAKWNSRAPHNG